MLVPEVKFQFPSHRERREGKMAGRDGASLGLSIVSLYSLSLLFLTMKAFGDL